jgi:hypothetical protein
MLLPVVTFQQGVGGYASALDTELREADPGTPQSGSTTITIDTDDGGGEAQGLLRFGAIFGNGAGQIPLGSTINSASLSVEVVNESVSGTRIAIHRMLVTWSGASTWTSLGAGVQRDDVEATAVADTALADPTTSGPHSFVGLAPTVQAWSDGGTNYGWAFFSNSTNGWDFASSDHGTAAWRPELTVDYTPPPLTIVKRAFELDGTPIPTGTTLPKGALMHFLVYVSNPRPLVDDVSLEDALDPGFEYVPGTMLFDSSTPSCADSVCTAAEEVAIYSAVASGTAGTDAVDADPVSFGSSTVSAGNQSVANAELDIPTGSVWGLVFTVRMR